MDGIEPIVEEAFEVQHEGGFILRTPSYEGPFELVLELIEKRKLSVSELSSHK